LTIFWPFLVIFRPKVTIFMQYMYIIFLVVSTYRHVQNTWYRSSSERKAKLGCFQRLGAGNKIDFQLERGEQFYVWHARQVKNLPSGFLVVFLGLMPFKILIARAPIILWVSGFFLPWCFWKNLLLEHRFSSWFLVSVLAWCF